MTDQVAGHHCPVCGRFAAFVRFIPWLDEFGGTLVLRCSTHGIVREAS